MVCFLMLDCALGEYDVETRIGPITTHLLPPDPVGKGLKPFLMLPEESDAFWKLMHGA